ncbi:hypothetical protein Lesp02_41220 [Lentzea sp. NBRC 105346]|uniref:DUF6346 domain-containing protein n=1 Tax=Lentzea sp. NBRC 105346 TaxID=3032205 RepID=UPI0024A3A75F|nr:DUF6346 domain-containing protein [Lentzea sp. NBRC 105346]GLZ31934.1 hypothetical protein Lesp02_41220 [Lentzea sp. NBRC 105346]
MIKLLHKLIAFLIVPLLGYLVGATIFIQFYDEIETGDLANAEYVAVARSCERQGPLTLRGFGYWWECRADVTRVAENVTRTMSTRGFLRPEHIGKKVAVNTTRAGREIVPEERPYQGLGGFLLIPFGILWLFVIAYVANPLLRKYVPKPGDRVEPPEPQPEVEEEPSREVFVWGGRKRWLKGPWLWLVMTFSAFVAVNFAESAFKWHNDISLIIFLTFACVPVLLIANGLRRFVFAPDIGISPEGLAWGKKKLTWSEVQWVHLSAKNVLSIQPHIGEVVRIGRFGAEQATRIHVAMGHFSRVPYTREDGSVPVT